ncbi:MAG: hypothetical protein HPY85_07580 [Anaerolineae bacterium]|nr:hypothetical protein [Anaerolineae bacterium]
MILLNFSHPITPDQVAQIEAITGGTVDRVVNLPTHFDNTQSFLPQFAALMAAVPLTAVELQTLPILVNLPSLNFIAGLVLAELHGRMGYFPPILRTRPVPEALPPRYEVVEILNLNQVREDARGKRY